jgi:hypothetical protein
MNIDKTKGTSPFVINHPRVVTSLAHPRQVLAQTCSRLRNSSRLAIVSIAKLALTKARPLALTPALSPGRGGPNAGAANLTHRLVKLVVEVLKAVFRLGRGDPNFSMLNCFDSP